MTLTTQWPEWISELNPELSESESRAALPADLNIVNPGSDVLPERAAWSGIWSGWGGANRVVDQKLVVEQVDDKGATVVVSRAVAGHGLLVQRHDAQFVDNELRFILDSGTVACYRLRHPYALEQLWIDSNENFMTGVLTRRDPDCRISTVRIPLHDQSDAQAGNIETLETIVFQPDGEGPFPVLLFNHGSTGSGNEPSVFSYTWTCPPLARYFTERGWATLFPQRRGRGKSDGEYDEGMASDGSGYSLDAEISLAGADRALVDIDAVLRWIDKHEKLDDSSLLVGGQSRGGILSVAFAGRHPDRVHGVLNFVGGWLSESCTTGVEVNQELFSRGAHYPRETLWLYADHDPFYSVDHSRRNFECYKRAGGEGTFQMMSTDEGQNGHMKVFETHTWARAVSDYLERIELS